MGKVEVVCPRCETHYNLDGACLGKPVRCRKCGHRFAPEKAEAPISPDVSTPSADTSPASGPGEAAKDDELRDIHEQVVRMFKQYSESGTGIMGCGGLLYLALSIATWQWLWWGLHWRWWTSLLAGFGACCAILAVAIPAAFASANRAKRRLRASFKNQFSEGPARREALLQLCDELIKAKWQTAVSMGWLQAPFDAYCEALFSGLRDCTSSLGDLAGDIPPLDQLSARLGDPAQNMGARWRAAQWLSYHSDKRVLGFLREMLASGSDQQLELAGSDHRKNAASCLAIMADTDFGKVVGSPEARQILSDVADSGPGNAASFARQGLRYLELAVKKREEGALAIAHLASVETEREDEKKMPVPVGSGSRDAPAIAGGSDVLRNGHEASVAPAAKAASPATEGSSKESCVSGMNTPLPPSTIQETLRQMAARKSEGDRLVANMPDPPDFLITRLGKELDEDVDHLVNLCSDDVAPLILALSADHSSVRDLSGRALAKIGSSAVEPLIESLKGSNLVALREAIEVLGMIKDSRAAPFLIPVVVSSFRDPGEKHFRARALRWAINALGNTRDESLIKPLIDAMEITDDEGIRSAAFDYLRKTTGQGLPCAWAEWGKWWKQQTQPPTGVTPKEAATPPVVEQPGMVLFLFNADSPPADAGTSYGAFSETQLLKYLYDRWKQDTGQDLANTEIKACHGDLFERHPLGDSACTLKKLGKMLQDGTLDSSLLRPEFNSTLRKGTTVGFIPWAVGLFPVPAPVVRSVDEALKKALPDFYVGAIPLPPSCQFEFTASNLMLPQTMRIQRGRLGGDWQGKAPLAKDADASTASAPAGGGAPPPGKSVEVESSQAPVTKRCPNCGVKVRGRPEIFSRPIACPKCHAKANFVSAETAKTAGLLDRLIVAGSPDHWPAQIDTINQLIALAPHDIPVEKLVALLNEPFPSRSYGGSKAFQEAMEVEHRGVFLLRKGYICKLCAVVAPKSADVARALVRILEETSAPVRVASPVAALFGGNLDQERVLCRQLACVALAMIGSPYADSAQKMLARIFADEKEDSAVRLYASPGGQTATKEARQLLIRQAQAEVAKKQGGAKQ